MHNRILLALLALTAALAVIALPNGHRAEASASSDLLLPDLQQDLPRVLSVEADGHGGWKLGFRSAVHNGGPGPLIVHGHRPDTATPNMTADQLILRADGETTTNPGFGELEFVISATHRHWHLLGFQVYELRRASDNALMAPGSKTGFCLQDSSTDPADLPAGKPAEPFFRADCGLEEPDTLEVDEGISVGWNDVYDPFREGQDVSLTGVPAGRYLLVHRTNVDGRVRELNRLNDAATLLLEVSWPGGDDAEPEVETLRSCPAARRCFLDPPRIALATVRGYARTALAGVARPVPRSARVSCKRAGSGGDCRVAFRRWRGSVRIRSTLAGGVPFYSWSARLTRGEKKIRKGSGRVRVPGA